MRSWAGCSRPPHDVRALKNVRLCAIGAGTAERFARFGIKVDLMPAESRAESVVQALLETGDIAGLRFLLPRADIGREVIGEELRKRGAEVEEVIAYRTVAIDPEREGEPDVYRMLLERRIDVVTFTSPSAVQELRRAATAPTRRPICCTRPSSRRSARSRPKRPRSSASPAASSRRTTPSRRSCDAIVAHFEDADAAVADARRTRSDGGIAHGHRTPVRR